MLKRGNATSNVKNKKSFQKKNEMINVKFKASKYIYTELKEMEEIYIHDI